MKKVISLLVVIMCLFTIVGCDNKKEKTNDKTDAIKFKEEYESLNEKTNASGLPFRKLEISEENPYVYITQEEVLKKIENKETFYLYIGDKQCPWCRSVIEKSIEVAKEYKVKKIYYVNIWDDDHNEILRDKYELNENNELVLTIKGTDAYYKMLEYFEPVLRDYTLTDSEGEIHETGEKRIYAPNYFYIRNGEVKKLIAGTSSLQTDSREELTDEILEDEQQQFEQLFSLDLSCDDKC